MTRLDWQKISTLVIVSIVPVNRNRGLTVELDIPGRYHSLGLVPGASSHLDVRP